MFCTRSLWWVLWVVLWLVAGLIVPVFMRARLYASEDVMGEGEVVGRSGSLTLSTMSKLWLLRAAGEDCFGRACRSL